MKNAQETPRVGPLPLSLPSFVFSAGVVAAVLMIAAAFKVKYTLAIALFLAPFSLVLVLTPLMFFRLALMRWLPDGPLKRFLLKDV